MANLAGFDAEKVAPETGFDPIPNGVYLACIEASEEKQTNAGDGSYVSLTLQIIDGDFKGRKLWHNLNLENKNDQAVGIARAQLSQICRATGILRPNDSSELHDIPMAIHVAVRKRKDTGEMQNSINKFEEAGVIERDRQPVNPGGGVVPGASNMPWKK